ncbi:MAG: GNAT family N-acetyltransferase [Chitinophagaceae bacterium]|nr:GNAT family N-acetyltransferase [Chitinophagaceae bacterium]
MHPLDNPIWQALHSADKRFRLGADPVAYFPEDVEPFAALPNWSVYNQQVLHDRLPPGRSWFSITAETIQFSPQWTIAVDMLLDQMVCTKIPDPLPSHASCRLLTQEDVPAMLTLTGKTKPGPFLANTIALGNYHGVFVNDALAAMAGERLHLDDYTEISAVCTDPQHSGKGYAAFLVAKLANMIAETGKTPFLHVRQDNTRAIQLYQQLGFEQRISPYFAIFRSKTLNRD